MTHDKKVKTMVLKTGIVKELGKGLVPRFSQFLTSFDPFFSDYYGFYHTGSIG